MDMHNLYTVCTSCENGPKMVFYKLGSMNSGWSLAFIIAQEARAVPPLCGYGYFLTQFPLSQPA